MSVPTTRREAGREVEDPRYRYLKGFQSKRLRDTYDDFASRPKYASACYFFFEEIYSTEDTTDRDESFRKIYGTVQRFLGGEVVESMTRLIELQELTIKLDMRILDVLLEREAPVEFGMETYESAYKLSENYQERVRQIELLEFTLRLIHKISHRFGIGMVLKGLRSACVLLGHTRMVDFLMSGYKAFADLKSIEPLVSAMSQRERERLDRIWALEIP
ncbi:hypothetical protein SCOR_09110 [Sulfidibacter corallicola]|uniref:DUF8198 domain-containing protein n=1 Tax=Sulfidibacter corallicola TaxID=2818388 RepID=A0A8A4TPF2_SULCO|nr:hypothetical protein [Sulfidibacter corallicola]QTD51084.1 hypothetical protein J3U87_01325 [Sulfidibacter corallicola]